MIKFCYLLLCLSVITLFCACSVGPNYQSPPVKVPEKYKEAPKNWKIAQPKDQYKRDKWWKVFKDPELNKLIESVNLSNQNIKSVFAQYVQARAIVDQAFAGFFPTLAANASVTRLKSASSGAGSGSLANTGLSNTGLGSTSTTTGGSTIGTTTENALNNTGTNTTSTSSTAIAGTGVRSSAAPITVYSASLNALWEPDLWGGVRRTVESAEAGAESFAALLASTELSMQATTAQLYFQLKSLDANQKLFNDTVKSYKESLQLTKNRYNAGVAAELDVLQAETQLQTAEVQAQDNEILRAQTEHAIAVLIGQPPASLCLGRKVKTLYAPQIPLQFPSTLLERRPDIGQAERLAAQANAQIGVQTAAFFPTISLTGNNGYTSTSLARLFTHPAHFWSLGAQLTELIFDGGLRCANLKIARAGFDQAVANYRQIVLAAFQDVEDNIVAVRQLKAEIATQRKAVANAKKALDITLNQYKAGTTIYLQVIIEQTTLFTAQKTLNDLISRQMIATVGLIKALGGGWDLTPLIVEDC